VIAGGWLGAPFSAEAERSLIMEGKKVTDKLGKEVILYKESHALVIGVSEYTNGWPRLPGVKSDVQEVKAALEAHGFNVIVSMNPDRDTLERAFNSFINQYAHNPENRLLFYFAGHGYTFKLAYGGEMGYIIPADAPLPENNEIEFLAKAMDMQMIEVYARRIQAKHALFLFDSCFSGSLFAISRAVPESISSKTANAVRQFITSGSANETVPDQSVFRQQFITALDGEGDNNRDGYVTGSELGIFLEDTVINYSRGSQHPQYGKIRDRYLDKGDFVFTLPEPQVAEATPTSLIPPDVTGSYGDIEAQLKWQEILSKMEEAFAMFRRYEDLNVPTEKKIAAWERFIKDFSTDNPNSTRDDELRNAAQERIAFWKESLLATPTQILQPPTPTPVLTATPQPPTPMPKIRIDNVILKGKKGELIPFWDNKPCLVKQNEQITIKVELHNPSGLSTEFECTAAIGKCMVINDTIEIKYIAPNTPNSPDIVTIKILDKNSREMKAHKSIKIKTIQ